MYINYTYIYWQKEDKNDRDVPLKSKKFKLKKILKIKAAQVPEGNDTILNKKKIIFN